MCIPTALWVGLHWCADCRRLDAQPPRFLPLPIRLFCRWCKVLARLQQAGPKELGPHGQAWGFRVLDGNR
jgi:hypothetical protein